MPFVLLLLFATLGRLALEAGVAPRSFSVEITATIDPSRSEIRLNWPRDTKAIRYAISRKSPSDKAWGSPVFLSGNSIGYIQGRSPIGAAQEFRVIKSTSLGFNAYGYIYTGNQVSLTEDRGVVILMVERTWSSELRFELARFERDLIGDGWSVRRHDISREDSVVSIRERIQAEHLADPRRVRAVILFGQVPVPYSGNIAPDGHPNHQGAWPADVYYGDVDGLWTDSMVEAKQAERATNWNSPGDGKFDQNGPPSEVELQVGRVDLSNLTCFANQPPARSERDLLRQYLNKNHAFRHGRMKVERRGLICTSMGLGDVDHFSGSGWRNFVPSFGSQNIDLIGNWEYLPAVRSRTYLWSHGSSGGSYYRLDAVGSSDDFAAEDIQVVFTMFVGSYLGDWNNESNFLRAALGSRSYVLSASYSGQPHGYFHHMALGATIGHGIRLTQNNGPDGLYPPHNPGSGQVHIALMGDPTLRLHPVIPPSGLRSEISPGGLLLKWSASTDSEVHGYHVYRANSLSGPYVRLTGHSLLRETTFLDRSPLDRAVYMVRAIKLERSPSGTYFNPSQGIFIQTGPEPSPQTPAVPSAPIHLTSALNDKGDIQLLWVDTAGNEEGFIIERKAEPDGNYTLCATVPPDATGYIDRPEPSGLRWHYRVSAFNSSGASPSSNETKVAALRAGLAGSAPTVRFLGEDGATRGNWQKRYGAEGYNLIGHANRLPEYARMFPRTASLHFWSLTTSEERALERASDTGRIAACWYGTTNFSIDLDLRDSRLHRVSFYFLDWDGGRKGRVQRIQIADPVSGAVIDSQVVSDFRQGKYLSWLLAGHVTVRLSAINHNAVLSGIFFDSDTLQTSGTLVATGRTPAIADANTAFPELSQVGLLNREPVKLLMQVTPRNIPGSDAPTSAGQFLRLQLLQPSGHRVIVETSGDLKDWTPILTNEAGAMFREIPLPAANPQRQRFYRARAVP